MRIHYLEYKLFIKITNILTYKYITAGTVICKQKQKNNFMYGIIKGKVSLRKRVGNERSKLI
jgi:hypothetical protein